MNRKKYLDKCRYLAVKFFGEERYNDYRKKNLGVEDIFKLSRASNHFRNIVGRELSLTNRNMTYPKSTWVLLKKYSDNSWGITVQDQFLEDHLGKSYKLRYTSDVIFELETGKIIKNRYGRISGNRLN